MIPPKRFAISLPDWGMLRRYTSRCVQMFNNLALFVCEDTRCHTNHYQLLLLIMAEDGGKEGGTFNGGIDRCIEKSQGWTTAALQ